MRPRRARRGLDGASGTGTRTQRIRWTFTSAGHFLAGSLIPGHWDAGMMAIWHVKE